MRSYTSITRLICATYLILVPGEGAILAVNAMIADIPTVVSSSWASDVADIADGRVLHRTSSRYMRLALFAHDQDEQGTGHELGTAVHAKLECDAMDANGTAIVGLLRWNDTSAHPHECNALDNKEQA